MFVCDVPRSKSDFLKIADMENELFDGMALSPDNSLAIFDFCPEVYSAIYGELGEIVGYSSVFLMRQEYAFQFISGELTEPDLTPNMLFSLSDPDFRTGHAYVGSVVVKDGFSMVTRSILLASLLSWRMTQMTRLALPRLPVFMIAVSDQGEQMVRFVGAKRLNDGARRKDGKAVYGRTITPGFMARANASLHRCMSAGLVQMEFDNCYKAEGMVEAPVC